MTSALQILIEAREHISDPDRWGKGMRAHRDDPTACCTLEAIEDRFPSGPEMKAAICALVNACPSHRDYGSMVAWNDAPERKREHVTTLYDRAIAAQGAKG